MNIKQTAVLLSSIFLASSTMAASKWSGDWFEVEIILLSQLHDKTTQAEVFSDYSPLPNYHQSLDLLTPYLTPDIATLKQQLPHCDFPHYQQSLVEQNSRWPELHPILSLEQIALQTSPITADETAINQAQQVELTVLADDNGDNTESSTLPATSDDDLSNTADTSEAEHLAITDAPQPITDEQRALVKAAEITFTATPFNYASVYNASFNTFCRITAAEFGQINPNPALYGYNKLPINNVPSTINGIEDLFSEVPYLTARQSLELSDIVKQLRRSKNFRPLLHMAWRQPVFDEEIAIPVKLFAGDNLQHHFDLELQKYQAQQQAEAMQEAQLSEIFNGAFNGQELTSVPTPQLSAEQQLMQAKQQKLAAIFTEIAMINDSQAVLDSLDSLAKLNSSAKSSEPTNDQTLAQQMSLLAAPLAPIQPWYLEGFLKVYLKGVYLNVAADFNILNFTLAEQASLKLRPNNNHELKAIRFKQNRRLISQEVHYFDHPYMGLIVQIRRHQRPEPEITTEDTEL